MSSQGDVSARPADGVVISTSRPWKQIWDTPIRGSVRRSCRRDAARFAPEESPAMMIFDGGIGSWKDLGGGERSAR